MGGFDEVLKSAQAANARQTLEGWQWALYLTSGAIDCRCRQRGCESRSLRRRSRTGSAYIICQRTRGFYITEALLHEGKLKYGEHTISHMQQLNQALGAVTPAKLAASPLEDNVRYLRYMVDTRLAEGKSAKFNVNFKEDGLSYAIALRNGVIAITERPNDGHTFNLSKNDWSQLITGEKTFTNMHPSLEAFDRGYRPLIGSALQSGEEFTDPVTDCLPERKFLTYNPPSAPVAQNSGDSEFWGQYTYLLVANLHPKFLKFRWFNRMLLSIYIGARVRKVPKAEINSYRASVCS